MTMLEQKPSEGQEAGGYLDEYEHRAEYSGEVHEANGQVERHERQHMVHIHLLVVHALTTAHDSPNYQVHEEVTGTVNEAPNVNISTTFCIFECQFITGELIINIIPVYM